MPFWSRRPGAPEPEDVVAVRRGVVAAKPITFDVCVIVAFDRQHGRPSEAPACVWSYSANWGASVAYCWHVPAVVQVAHPRTMLTEAVGSFFTLVQEVPLRVIEVGLDGLS